LEKNIFLASCRFFVGIKFEGKNFFGRNNFLEEIFFVKIGFFIKDFFWKKNFLSEKK